MLVLLKKDSRTREKRNEITIHFVVVAISNVTTPMTYLSFISVSNASKYTGFTFVVLDRNRELIEDGGTQASKFHTWLLEIRMDQHKELDGSKSPRSTAQW